MKKEIENRPIKYAIIDGVGGEMRVGKNLIAQNFLHSNIVNRQSKKNIAEELSTISLTMQNLLKMY